ncbi:hypothetical protein F4780DRAFT_739380 [Xylariomycetidae sp. FL0641]|nr:hypothetical protein F4780DRAFT_739380 [Xylariomycetidae sp. FL0641]
MLYRRRASLVALPRLLSYCSLLAHQCRVGDNLSPLQVRLRAVRLVGDLEYLMYCWSPSESQKSQQTRRRETMQDTLARAVNRQSPDLPAHPCQRLPHSGRQATRDNTNSSSSRCTLRWVIPPSPAEWNQDSGVHDVADFRIILAAAVHTCMHGTRTVTCKKEDDRLGGLSA